MTLRRMSLILGSLRQIAATQNVATNRCVSTVTVDFGKNTSSTEIDAQQRQFSVSSSDSKQSSSISSDLNTQLGKNRRSSDSDIEPVPLSYISYEDKSKKSAGSKKSPLIIQHSLIGSKENWKTVAKEIHHVTKRSVYSIDARNHGDSPRSDLMCYAAMAKDIENFIGQIEVPKISFLGHSFGGRIGLFLAMMRPELIDKLVVVDSSPFVNKFSIKRWSLLREAGARLQSIEAKLKDCSGVSRRSLADKTIEDVLTDKKDRALFLSNLITSEEKNGKSRLWRVNLDAILNNPTLMAEYPDVFCTACECRSNLTRYHGKVLFIGGDRSQFVRRDDETSIRVLFPNAEFIWFSDAGHWIHVEKHEQFMSAIVPFLED